MLISQNFSVRGHLWYSGLSSNDIPKNYSPVESKIGTISTFSMFKDFSNNQLLDFDYAHKIDHTYSGDSITVVFLILSSIIPSIMTSFTTYSHMNCYKFHFW